MNYCCVCISSSLFYIHFASILHKLDEIIEEYRPAILLTILAQISTDIIIELQHHLPCIWIDTPPLLLLDLIKIFHKLLIKLKVAFQVEPPKLYSRGILERLHTVTLKVKDVQIQLSEYIAFGKLIP